MSEINIAGAMRGICAREHQLTCQRKCVFVGTFKHERTGIGEYGGVQASRNLRRNLYSSFSRQAVNHLRSGNRFRIDPVHIGKGPAADVMVNVDQKTVFQTLETGTLNTVALQNNGSFVIAFDANGAYNRVGKRQWLINARHPVMQNDIGVLAHGSQDLATS